MVDLSQFLNQAVNVTYRNGETDTVVIESSGELRYPYVIEGRTYTQNGLYFSGKTDDWSWDWDVVELITPITPINNTSNNNNQMRPVTIQDYIDLLTAVKEKYGDLNVVYVSDDDVAEKAVEFVDVIVTGGCTSLIRNRSIDNERSQLVFVTQ